mmetsp:Transcript_28504/g.45837  ORF Transcript_28504/g.45837 Transcript_28504/m.45837 type:complete len:538 (-) Transcript_28504:19-1632(-)
MLSCRAIRKPIHACLSRAWSSGANDLVDRTSKLFIGNEYVSASTGNVIPVVSPIDGQQFASIAHASEVDVDRAVQSARQCFDSSPWRSTSPEDRALVLQRVAAKLRDPPRLSVLSEIETRDCGKPLVESEADIAMCADIFDYYAKVAPQEFAPSELEVEDSAFQGRILKEPLGVIGCVSPWNFPLQQAVLKIAPALAAGCSVVVKPSPLASLTTCALGEILAESGVAPGAVNIVTGGPPDQILIENGTNTVATSTGQCLIDHALLDKLSFTGSGAAGTKMLEASSRRLRPTSLELGGKSAFLVFDDAEPFLDALVDWILIGIFLCQGQVCTATSRLLVQENIADKLTERLIKAASQLSVGDPMLRETQMGPVVSANQQRGVLAAIRQAQSDGCVVHAPQLKLPSGLQGGFFVPPTILTSVPEDCAAWRDEIFGPVLAIRQFRTESEAIQVANRSSYGLANAVFSKDLERCARVAAQLKSGVVWENCSQPLFPSTPMGGLVGKQSGFGHEFGTAGLKEYINYKTVVSTSPGHSWNWYG